MAKRNTNTNAFRKKINIFLGIGVSLVVVAVMFAISVGGYGKVVHKTLNVQAGTKSIALEDFIIQNDKGYEISLISDLSKVNLSKIGTYPVELQVNKSKVKCEVVVADTEAPTATPVNTTLLAGTTVRAEKLVKDIKDFSSVLVEYKDQPDYSTLGKQNVTIVLTDEYANKREIVVELNITEDNTPPEIKGVKDLRAYVGGTINYRKNVKVTDDHDSNPTFTVDSSKVDISKEGTYTVKYIATDAAGNTAEKTAKVVVSRKVESKEDKKLAAIDLADKVLDNIIKPGMSTKEQVKAIYNWARGNIGYSGHSDKSDYQVEAYNGLKNRGGDCFTYYAVTKLMFERLDIPNIDVKKVKNYPSDSNHYWSLVSVDGGKTYYHFDATPRKGDGDNFCLVTDAFLDAYSNSHGKCHNRNKSLYPATPAK
jgi:hypothetical protein